MTEATPKRRAKRPKTETRVVSCRVAPETKLELECAARRISTGRPSVLGARILEAFARGNAMCKGCGHEHPIYHPEVR